MKTNKTRKAFTLVELLVVIAVLAILATVSVVGYSEFIKNAAISNDNHLMSQLNSYLDAYKVQNRVNVTAENVREITNKILQDGGVGSDLIPQSAKYGYHFYFNLEEGEYQLIRDDQAIQATSRIRALRSRSRVQTNNPQLVPEMSFTNLGLFFLDTSGSPLADAISGFYNINSKQTYIEVYTAMQSLNTKDGAPITRLSAFMDEIVVITDDGNLYAQDETSSAVYFASGVTEIGNSKFIWDGNAFEEGSKTSALVNLDAGQTITVPSSVMLVAPNALTVNPNTPNAQEQITINFDLTGVELNGKTEIEYLAEVVVDRDFTNATFAVVGNEQDKYVINDDIITKVGDEGSEAIVVDAKRPVADFAINCVTTDEDEKILFNPIDAIVQVAYGFGTFTLEATNFVGSDGTGDNLTSTNVVWESNSDVLTVDNGVVTINKLPTIAQSTDGVTITATVDGGVQKTATVHVAILSTATLTIGGQNLDMTEGTRNTIDLSYDGTVSSFDISAPSVFTTLGADWVSKLDKNTTVTTSGDLFKIENNKLVLTAFSGTQNLTVQVGANLTKEFVVTVADNSSSPFEVKLANAETYLYRVGNGNSIKMETLFNAIKDVTSDTTLTIYDASLTTDRRNPIASNGVFACTYPTTLTASDWAEQTIKFTGSGVVILVLDTNGKQVELALEVVDGYNVTNYSELLANSSNNIIFLSDIAMMEDNYDKFGIRNGNYWYGNGFTFDVTDAPYVAARYQASGEYGIINITSGSLMDNLRVVGAVYPGAVFTQSQDYYNAVINLIGGTISNSYVANCNAAVMSDGGTIINSTLEGGRYANIFVKSGVLTLEDVTTINEPVNGVAGLGVFVDSTSQASIRIDIVGSFVQHNWISENDKNCLGGDVLLSTLFDMMFKKDGDYVAFHHTYNGVKYVNMGIAYRYQMDGCLTGNIPTAYQGIDAEYMGVAARIYSIQDSKYDFTGRQDVQYSSNEQGAHNPTYTWSYPAEYNSDFGRVELMFEEGSSVSFNPNVLAAQKYGYPLVVGVSLDGTDYTDKNIEFNQAGNYTITYTIVDEYAYDANGEKLTTSNTFTKTLLVKVNMTKKAAVAPDFTFYYGTSGKASGGSPHVAQPSTTTPGVATQVGDEWYMSAQASESANAIGKIVVDGVTIRYPIVDGINVRSGNSTDYDFQRYYPIFKAIAISDNGAASYSYDTTEYGNVTWVSGTMDEGNGAMGLADGTVLYSNRLCRTQKKAGNNESGGTSIIKYSYTAVDGNTYYYYVGYRFYDEDEGGGCVTSDTLVTLVDGTQKQIQYVTENDLLLVWDFFNGEFAVAPSAIIYDHGYAINKVIKLNFSDGTQVKVVNMHQFFITEFNTFVTVTEDNISDFVGCSFAKQNSNGLTTVTLTSYSVSEEYERAMGINSAYHYNIFVEGMLSEDFYPQYLGIFNYFAYGDNMMFDQVKMQADIEKYGLYTYEDFADYLTVEQFAAFNVQYLKISVGKGETTFEGILALIEEFLNK